MAINYYVSKAGAALVTGLAADAKPASQAGFMFIETDTGKLFYPDGGGAWTEAADSGAAWGGITGTLSDQSDLQTALNGKQVAGTYATGTGSATGTNTGDNATNTQYSGLAASKQDTLVSGTNIKTINGASVLGSGDLLVTAGDPSYSPGSFTVATETAKILCNHLKLTTTQRATLAGTGRLRLSN